MMTNDPIEAALAGVLDEVRKSNARNVVDELRVGDVVTVRHRTDLFQPFETVISEVGISVRPQMRGRWYASFAYSTLVLNEAREISLSLLGIRIINPFQPKEVRRRFTSREVYEDEFSFNEEKGQWLLTLK